MEIISKISKGTKMDQIYIPKNRPGLDIGTYVKIIPIEETIIKRPYFYNIKEIEPIKLELVNKIFNIIETSITYENIIISGSFLEKGFSFNDIDVLLIKNEKLNEKGLQAKLENQLKIEMHLIHMTEGEFRKALVIDPIWRLVTNKCMAIKRIPPLPTPKLNYKYLDLQQLKSELLIINFDYSSGNEKYKWTRNLMAIYLFIKNKKLTKENIEKEIERKFNLKIEDIKNNIVEKEFLRKYKEFYKKFEKEIIKNAAKQEKIN
ncbi:hypothetical protein J4442_02685 [Candidatus Woesearchaeota archaeon]|nr:hypothetical protein [Candidatus Woesearchaeota archaeon]